MKRSPIVRKTPLRAKPRHQPNIEREDKPMALSPATRKGSYTGAVTAQPIAKDNPVRSEAYRRLVAQMPCRWCGREGLSQAAHPNTGKGMSLKTDDRRCFPLCFTCHAEYDQGASLTREQRRDMGAQWEKQTRADVVSAGRWPSNVPAWKEEA